MGNPSKEERALVLWVSRSLRRRWKTAVRRINLQNELAETFLQANVPTFDAWLSKRRLEETYSTRVGLPARQDRSQLYMKSVLELDDPTTFYQALGDQLSKYTTRKVTVQAGMTNTAQRPAQRSIWFGTAR